jgi:hypothetical protein
MSFRVVLKMSDSSALVTVAMLSALLKERHTDYLDIISPFILELLPKDIGQKVNTNEIIIGLKDEFGFEQFPIHVLSKILIRCSKTKYGYLERKNGNFFVKKSFSNQHFRECQSTIRSAQSTVMEELQSYLQVNSKYTKITLDETREKFLAFLELKGLVFIDGVEELKTVTNRDYDVYQVARFVLSEREKRSTIYFQIEEVVRGFFVYKSIYFFSRESVVSLTEKMTGTTVYFDTPLLIEVLGYNTTEGEIASNELIQLVKSCGGQIKTFSHLIDEVAGILTAFARDKARRSLFSLQNLMNRNYDEIDIYRLRSSLEKNLLKLGITIEEPISVTDFSLDEYSPLQINDLAYAIQIAYHQETQTNRSDNDVISVATVYHLRGNARASALDNCRAVIVTSNLAFAHTVSEFYNEKTSHDVGFVISDIDLTSVLWLRSWDKKGNLPTSVLLENAYAACQPSAELISTFSSTIEKLRLEGKISDDEALLLRTQRVPRDDLLEESKNDPAYVTDHTVLEIKKRYETMLVDRKDDEISRLQNELMRERASNHEKDKERRNEALNRAETTASEAAEDTHKFWSILTKILSAIILVFGIAALCYSQFKADIGLVWEILLTIIGAFGLIDVLRSRNGYITRFIEKRKRNKFDSIYETEVTRINTFFLDGE